MDLHTAKTRLQEHLSDGLMLVVGSGLSCAEGLPGMGALATHLRATIGPQVTGADAALWAEIEPLITTKGLEAALLEKPPTQALEALLGVATAQLVGDTERNTITEVFAGHKKLRLTRLMGHLIKPSTGLPIVTTNYDRLVEIAVEEAGIGVDTMFSGRFAGSLNEKESRLSFCRNVTLKKRNVTYHYHPRATVYKPHGSLDWYLRNGLPVFYAGDLHGATRLIITPGHNKFRNGYDSPFDLHRGRANEAINRSSRFLIIGYGFNDDHLETHLLTAIQSGKPTLIMTYELSAKARALAAQLSSVVALERHVESGVEGTLFHVERTQHFFPSIALWDVHSFITEVLEP